MSTYQTTLNVQEAAAEYANNTAAEFNDSIADIAGVDVMWFRATPDKRNQDVVFQSYTLWGVEDCPLEFKALYSDTGYDNAILMANIMGIEYQVPLTLEVAVNTWYKVTNYDGTYPQKGDIVFIPMTKKLIEVVSMTPVKAIAGQLTSFKMNCAVYKPTRSRILGENLKTSIEESTTNLDKSFGDAIDSALKNMVDDKELSLFSSTEKDKYKTLPKTTDLNFGKTAVLHTISGNIEADGHIVARSWYDMDTDSSVAVSYKNINDTVTENDTRSLTCWFKMQGSGQFQNIKSMDIEYSSRNAYITIKNGKKLEPGTFVSIERNTVVIPGTVISNSPLTISVNYDIIKGLDSTAPVWKNLPGYILKTGGRMNLLTGKTDTGKILSVDIAASKYLSVTVDNDETLYQFINPIEQDKWYGAVLNAGAVNSLDIFSGEPRLERTVSVKGEKNILSGNTFTEYFIASSKSCMTNIRYYRQALTDIDKQITDLVSYNTPYDSLAIINDSADIYLHKNYYGTQR